MNTQQIGRAGELLVQYKLLKYGIDSSALTTDSGIDIVAYSPKKKDALTIQVKANEKAKPGGGAGSLALDWWLRENSPADLVAVASIESNEVWLFLHKEFVEAAQQKSNGRLHFYMYLSDDVIPAGSDGDSFWGFPAELNSESMWRTDWEVRHGQSGCVTGGF